MKTLGTNKYSGFTLLEVMVALLVLSIGLLGLAMLQATNLQFNTDAYTRTQATLFAYDIIDRMRANSPQGNTAAAITKRNLSLNQYKVLSNSDYTTIKANYDICIGGTCKCDSSVCDSSNLATYDLGKWYEMHDKYLPGASKTRATVGITAANLVTVTIFWTEKDFDRSQKWVVQL
jgi:type IV pilus assembly protein PilV